MNTKRWAPPWPSGTSVLVVANVDHSILCAPYVGQRGTIEYVSFFSNQPLSLYSCEDDGTGFHVYKVRFADGCVISWYGGELQRLYADDDNQPDE